MHLGGEVRVDLDFLTDFGLVREELYLFQLHDVSKLKDHLLGVFAVPCGEPSS
jgi:hypothetical protein